MIRYLKEVLILLYLLKSYDYYLERLLGVGLSVSALFYLGLFVALVIALVGTAYIRNTVLRIGFAVLFFVSAVFFDVYMRVTADYMSYSAFVSLVYSGGFIMEALNEYRAIIMSSLASGLLLLFGIAVKPRGAGSRWNAWHVAAPVLGILLLSGMLFMRSGEGARGLPIMFTPLAYSSLFVYEAAHNTIGPREPVKLLHTTVPVDHDIVLIIDESITGNYLDLNTEHGVRSQLLQPPAGVNVINYGYAASIANCSADTNITLRFGGTRSDYVRINSTMPSLWQYAKRAGLATVYIDAQRTGGNLQNRMSETEKKDIDQFVQFDDTPVRDRDMAAAQALIDRLNDGQAQLIVINKVGAHFPVHDKYPDEFMQFRPALPRGRYNEVSDTGNRDGFAGASGDWALYRNAYKNTVLWNVGEFFTRVFAKANLNNAVMIYTSDHGQDLHERGNPGLNTHCGDNPVDEEGLVPLVIIQGEKLKTPDWQAALAGNRNHSSHYNIFPTLLQLMGYELSGVEAVYGHPLSQPTRDEFSFNTQFNARLAEKPVFKHIDLNEVVTPTDSMAQPVVSQSR
ncbi:Sulfatase [compost metagenome]